MYKDLLEQALRLAKLDAKKPKQANLRRAISSAYYALFHMLVNEACRVQVGRSTTRRRRVRFLGGPSPTRS